MAEYLVFDISFAQGAIDWAKVAEAYRQGKFTAVIIQCGYGNNDTRQDDKWFAVNSAACEKYGIPYDIYLFSYAYTTDMALSEAQHAIRLAAGRKVKRIWYDLEVYEYGAHAKTCMNVFGKAVKDAGYDPGLYTYEYYYNAWMRGYDAYPIWIAKYSSAAPQIGKNYIGWQYTSGYPMVGFSGGIDASRFYYNYWASEKKAGGIKKTTEKAKKETFSPYLVKVAIPDLNIRSGPGLSYSVVGTCPQGVYTIVGETKKDGYTWGKLKSGVGRIALEYTTKL